MPDTGRSGGRQSRQLYITSKYRDDLGKEGATKAQTSKLSPWTAGPNQTDMAEYDTERTVTEAIAYKIQNEPNIICSFVRPR